MLKCSDIKCYLSFHIHISILTWHCAQVSSFLSHALISPVFLFPTFQESSDPSNIRNPCYHDGFNITFDASSIYDTECTKKSKNYKPDQKLVMVGAADSDKCRSIVRSIFDFKTCSSSQCSFNGVEQPSVTGEFMVRPSRNACKQTDKDAKPPTGNILHVYCSWQAYAGFFYTAKILGLNGTSDLDQFNSSVKKYCHKNWGVVSSSNWTTATVYS